MPHLWDKIDSALENVGPQSDLTEGLKNLLSNIGDNGGPNDDNIRRVLWRFGLWATKNFISGGTRFVPEGRRQRVAKRNRARVCRQPSGTSKRFFLAMGP